SMHRPRPGPCGAADDDPGTRTGRGDRFAYPRRGRVWKGYPVASRQSSPQRRGVVGRAGGDREVATTAEAPDPDATAASRTAALPIAGMAPTFRHLDDPDMTWQQCRRQRNADGSESSVWEKWLAFSPDPQYLSLYARYDPGMIVRRHGHLSPHLVFVI